MLCHTTRILFKVEIQDPNVAYRLYRRNALNYYLNKLSCTQESINVVIAVLMKSEHPEQVIEIPIPFRLPTFGKSREKFSALVARGLCYLKELVRLRLTIEDILPLQPIASTA